MNLETEELHYDTVASPSLVIISPESDFKIENYTGPIPDAEDIIKIGQYSDMVYTRLFEFNTEKNKFEITIVTLDSVKDQLTDTSVGIFTRLQRYFATLMVTLFKKPRISNG